MNSIFDITTTDMGYYDSILRGTFKQRRNGDYVSYEIKYISPDEYLKECARVHNSTVENQYRMICNENLDDLELASKTKKLPMILIDEYDKTQEGRHRALVAKRLDIEKIPVMYIY